MFGGTIRLNGADEYKRNLSSINSELRLLSKEMQANGASAENASKQLDLYNRKIEEQKRYIESIEKELEKENSAVEKNAGRIATLEKMLNNARTALIGMEQELEGAQQKFDKLSQAADKLSNVGGTLTDLGNKAAAFSTAMAGIAAGSGKLAADFETGFAKVSTLINDSSIDMNALAEDTRKLSSAVNVSTNDMNEAFYSALSAGVEITSDYGDTLEFLEQNAKIATAGFTDMQTAIDTTTTVLNAYGMSLDETNRIHETLINTQNLGKTTVAELGASLSQVVPTAAALGIDIEQVGAAFAAMTAQGIPTAQAATQIRSALSELSKEGQTAYDNFEKLSGESFKDFIAGGGTLNEAMKILADGAQAAGSEVNSMFGSVEAANTALVLAGDTGFVKFNDSLLQMRGSAGVVDEAFEKMSETAAYKATKAINDLKNAGIELGQSLLPTVEAFAGKVSEFAKWFDQLDDSTKESIAQFTLMGAALAPVLIGLGNTITAVSNVIGVVQKLNTALTVLTATNPHLLALAAVAVTVAAAFEAVREKTDELEKSSENMGLLSDELSNKMRDQSAAYKDNTKEIEENANKQRKEAEEVKNLLPRLDELAKKTERSKEENRELKAIVDELNDAIPDLNLYIDETTGALSLNTEEIYKNIAAYEQRIKVMETEAKLESAVKRKIEAETNYREAQKMYGNLTVEEGTEGGMGLGAEQQIKEEARKIISTAELEYKNAAYEVDRLNKELNDIANPKTGDNALEPAENLAGGTKKKTSGGALELTKEEAEKIKNGIEVWKYRRDKGIITEEEYYRQLERIRDQYFAKDSAEWRKYDLEIYNWRTKNAQTQAKAEETAEKERLKAAETAAKESAKAAEQARKDEFDSLKYSLDRGIITEEEYYTQLAGLRDKYFAENTSEWQKYDLQIYNWRKKQNEDMAKESAEALKKAYTAQQAASYEWVSDRVFRGDFADYGTNADESYNRIYQRAVEAFENGVITIDELTAEADKITAAKLNDYKTEKQKLQTFVDERNFYNDWDAYNTNEEKVLRQMLENADRYYAQGILQYKDYLEEVRGLSRSIYTAQANEQEVIMQAAQERMQQQLNTKRTEINEQIAALNKEVSDLRAKHTAQSRARQLSELNAEIKDFSNAVTIRGQEHYKELLEERESLLWQQEEEELARRNNEIIEQLEAEYSQMEAEQVSLLSKIAENTQANAIAAEFEPYIEKLQDGLGQAVSTTISRIIEYKTNITNNNKATQNIYPADNVDLAAAMTAFARKLV